MSNDPFLIQKWQRAIEALQDLSEVTNSTAVTAALQSLVMCREIDQALFDYEEYVNHTVSLNAYIDDYKGYPVYGLHGLDAEEVDDISNAIELYGSNYVRSENMARGCLLLSQLATMLGKEVVQ